MAGIAVPVQGNIDGQRVVLHHNKRELQPRTWYQRITWYSDQAFGVFRLGQLGDRAFKVANMLSPHESFGKISKMFNQMWIVTIIPRLFGASKDAKDALLNRVQILDPEAARRQNIMTIFTVTDGVAAWGYASSLFLGCVQGCADLSVRALKMADMVTFLHDITDAQINAEDFNEARILAVKAEQIGGGVEMKELQDNLVETQRFHFLKTLKAVCSLAGFLLGLGFVATAVVASGNTALLALTAGVISLTSTIFAMSAGLYQESMKYEPVKFFDEKHVQVIPIGAAR